jgi:hypothetical protein
MKKLALILVAFICFATAKAQKNTPIKVSDLPAIISEDIYARKIGWKITEVFSDSSNNTVNYEIVIEMGKNKMHLFYDSDGYYVRGIDQKALDRQAAKSSEANKSTSK